MVTSVGVLGSTSFLNRSLFPPGQLLLADRCCQELPEVQQTAEHEERTHEHFTNLQVVETDSTQQTDHAELINAAAPRVSCCLLEASMALSEKRIEDLCAQLLQASTILDEVLAVVSPTTDEVLPRMEAVLTMAAQVEPLVEVDLPPFPEDSEITAAVEIPRAMAAAA